MPEQSVTLSEQVAVEHLAPGYFRSYRNPTQLGDVSPYGFGGNSLAIAVNAAYQTIRESFHMYSICGHFIRPAKTNRQLFCLVETTRRSRAFETCEVKVFQQGDDGSRWMCLMALADFHFEEHRSMVVYSTPPKIAPSPSISASEISGSPTRTMSSDIYRHFEKFVDVQPVPIDNSLIKSSERSNAGLGGKSIPLAPPQANPETFRVPSRLRSEADQVSALAFYMDRGLAYIPAIHSGYQVSDASACATLDFSLRLFRHTFDLQNWHKSEQQTIVAEHARAFSEGRVWDPSSALLASMTQQTILRPSAVNARM